MATLRVTNSAPGLTLPLFAIPSITRIGSPSSSKVTYTINDGEFAGGRLVLGGSALAFAADGNPLPSGGTVTSITLQRPGDFATWSVLSGVASTATDFRAGAGNLWGLLLGGADTLLGGAGSDRMAGSGGNDRVFGYAGNDELFGQEGNDLIEGGDDDDTLTGGAGKDTIRGGAGDDQIRLNAVAELVVGEVIDGGDGNDTLNLRGAAGTLYDFTSSTVAKIETIRFDGAIGLKLSAAQMAGVGRFLVDYNAAGSPGGELPYMAFKVNGSLDLGNLPIELAAGARLRIVLDGGGGTVFGRDLADGSANDTIRGDSTNNSILSGQGDDVIEGGDGRDYLDAGEGDDSIFGDTGDDVIYARLGNDLALGGDGNDELYGQEGDDILFGGAGNDKLYGTAGSDTLDGGDGGDLLVGGEGADLMSGGAGSDTYLVDNTLDRVIEAPDAELSTDIIRTYVSFAAGEGIETIRLLNSLIRVDGGEDDNLIEGYTGNETLVGRGGDDILYGGPGGDLLAGGNDRDVFLYKSSKDSVFNAQFRDRIQDLGRGQGDVIDLSGIDANTALDGNQAFTNLSIRTGSNAPAGSLRYQVEGESTLVYGYTDTVSGSDFCIEIVAIGIPVLSDFIL